jgi:hypothetical protein
MIDRSRTIGDGFHEDVTVLNHIQPRDLPGRRGRRYATTTEEVLA